MPSTPSPSLRVELQETGDSLNVWGTKLNQGLLLLEQAVTGILIKPLTGNVTLGVANYVSDEARNATLVFTAGSGLSAAPTVTVPSAPKSWHVDNRCGYPITFTMGGTPVTVPVGRQADVFCDGANLFMLEPIAAAAAVTEQFALSAATSAQTAMTSASTATTRRDQALAARDETYAARDLTLTYRNTTLGYRDAAAASATQAANSAAGVNLPAVSAADAGKALVVKSDGSGYAPQTIAQAPIYPIAITSPAAGATVTGTQTFTASATGYAGDTTGFFSLYGFPQASRTLNVYQTGTPNVVFKSQTTAGAGNSVTANLQSLGLTVSTQYLAEMLFTDVLGNVQRTAKQTFTTPASYLADPGQSSDGGFMGAQNYGDGPLNHLILASKSTEASKVWQSSTSLVGAYSRVNGPGNTTLIGGSTAQAAGYAQSISIGGVAGYLWAIDEARAIASKLKPSAATVAAFQVGGSEVFTNAGHWSSTELTAASATAVDMTAGSEGGINKTTSALVRAIKRVSASMPYAIGTAMEGGYLAAYFTDLSSGSPVLYMLIVADKATEVTRAWDVSSQGTQAFNSRTNGSTIPNLGTGFAAIYYAQQLVSGGKDDWYLGAIDEMLAIARMNASLPSGQQLATGSRIWSSTEVDASNAKSIAPSGSETSDAKSSSGIVRPIRRVAITI